MASKIAPCLWFNGAAEQAAGFYVSLFDNSSIDSIHRYGEGEPFPAGTALLVEFTLDGLRYQALNGGPQFPHSEAISLSVSCRDQAEVDRLWEALTGDGGKESMCGWLQDRFGVSWQIVPQRWIEIMTSNNETGKKRAMAALYRMRKLDIKTLETAFAGG